MITLPHRFEFRSEVWIDEANNAHFNRGTLRSLEPKKTDVQMLHRNSLRLGEMLGEDNWFDKMPAAGRDYLRFEYMQRLQAFTEKQKRVILAGAD